MLDKLLRKVFIWVLTPIHILSNLINPMTNNGFILMHSNTMIILTQEWQSSNF